MATVAALVEEIMLELGKDSIEIRTRVEAEIRNVVVDLLSANDGRFPRLETLFSFTLAASAVKQELPADFNTESSKFIETDDSGKKLREILCMPEADYYRRGVYDADSPEIAYITDDATTGSYWLNFTKASDEVRYIKFFYFRVCTSDDCTLIRNTSLIKRGVRGGLPDLFPLKSQVDLTIFTARSQDFSEGGPSELSTEITMRPPAHIERHNRQMRRIGRGN